MREKGFTEAQIILFIIILGICILILVPILDKVINFVEETIYEHNVNDVIESSKMWLERKQISDLSDGDTYYVETNELVSQNFLDEEKISGCIKIVYQENLKDYNYSYNNGVVCSSIMSGKDKIILNVVTGGDGLYKEEDEYIFKGDNPDNYILINSILYRILSIDKNGIKAIREKNIETRAWDSPTVRTEEKNSYCNNNEEGCNAYVANGTEVTQDSEIHQYLETVYSKITSSDIILNDTGIWGVGTVEAKYSGDEVQELVNANTITSNIGLINMYDYRRVSTSTTHYSRHNWLNTGESFWTLTAVTDTNNMVWSIDKSGKIVRKSAGEIDGVRPVLNISGTINLLGSGTSSDPYILNITK